MLLPYKLLNHICSEHVNFNSFRYAIRSCTVIITSHILRFSFQVHPDSQYARPLKRANAFPVGVGSGDKMKSQQLIKELTVAAQNAKESARLPNNKTEDQNLSEEKMAIRYAG